MDEPVTTPAGSGGRGHGATSAFGANASRVEGEGARAFGDPAVGDVLGPYKLLEMIGEGGFGMVFLAEQREPVRRRVALKVLKAGMDSREVLARFDAERHALALMDHPGVAKVHDAGVTGRGRPYFVMEHVAGLPLTRYCEERRLRMGERLALFSRVCAAVQHAHQKGIIHRDLKPSNILVVEVDGAALPKVIDFGIAKATASPLTDRTLHTEAGRMIGTPEYMSPEQAGSGGADIDTRTDVYALGVVLYQLLTGTFPFEPAALRRAGDEGIRRMIIEVDPPKPSTKLGSLPTRTGGRAAGWAEASVEVGGVGGGGGSPSAEDVARERRTDAGTLRRLVRGDLDWIVMKCLEKERSRRYDSASGLAADIERHLRHEPVSAGPPSAAYRGAKFLRRNRAGVAVAGVLALVVAAALAATTTLYARESMQRKRAETEAAKARAGNAFLTAMFESIDPANSAGAEIRVREVLDAAAAGLDAQGVAEPEVEASIRDVLGTAYHQLGLYPASTGQLEKALELREGALGPDRAETLVSAAKLGQLMVALRELDRAEALTRRAYEGRSKVLGAMHSDTLVSQALLGFIQQLRGDFDGALETTRRVLEAQMRTVGAMDPTTLDTRASLADILEDMGRYDEALEAARSLAADTGAALGPDDPSSIQARSIVASVAGNSGKDEEAERAAREVVEASVRVLGLNHARTLTAKNVHLLALKRLKRTEEALAVGREIVAGATAALGAEHPSTLTYRANLAAALHAAGRLEEAEPIYREVVAIRSRDLGPREVDTLVALNGLGQVLQDSGRAEEALPLLREVLAGVEATMPQHWMASASRTFVASCLMDAGELEEAAALGERGYAELVERLGSGHPRTKTAAGVMAEVRERMGDAAGGAAWRARE